MQTIRKFSSEFKLKTLRMAVKLLSKHSISFVTQSGG
jgi:hypothetical protein